MKIIDWLLQFFGVSGAPNVPLLGLLEQAGERAPDLKPALDEWRDKLAGAASGENLTALAEEIKKELANIGQGKTEPRDHPSDLGG